MKHLSEIDAVRMISAKEEVSEQGPQPGDGEGHEEQPAERCDGSGPVDLLAVIG